jgi:hypothetical protein
MCPKANGWRVSIHLPHGYVSYATWSIFWISLYPSLINRLVCETLGSRTLGCRLPCSTCCKAGTEHLANREAVGVGREKEVADPLTCTPQRKTWLRFAEIVLLADPIVGLGSAPESCEASYR